jgi:hypothetical protein
MLTRRTALQSVTPLTRTRPLDRSADLKRGSHLTLVRDITSAQSRAEPPKRKSRPQTGFSPAVKLATRTRAGQGDPDDAVCEACGIWLGRYGGEVQHRDARGMGGSSAPIISSIVNAVLLCGSGALRTGCHGKCEDRGSDDSREMQARGFWLEEGQDPAAEPIAMETEHRSGITVWLLPDGTYGFEDPDGGDAA